MKKSKSLFTIALQCLLISTLLFACNSSKETAPVFKTVNSVPIYDNFEDLAPIFEQHNDTTYIINFWATWCKPCVEELPFFEELNKKYQKEKVKVILVSLDFKKKIESKLIPFINERKLISEVLVLTDPKTNTWIDAIAPEWSGAIPMTVFYRNDKRAMHEASFETYDEINTIVQSFLKH